MPVGGSAFLCSFHADIVGWGEQAGYGGFFYYTHSEQTEGPINGLGQILCRLPGIKL